MYEAVMAQRSSATVVIKAAAVADYRPSRRATEKVKKQGQDSWQLEMEKNPDILGDLGRCNTGALLVGFAAETSDLRAHAQKKLEEKNLDLIVANDVTQKGAGFDVPTNIVRLLFRDGRDESLPLMRKEEVAHLLLDRVADLLRRKKS
jgi:phosphopantothenoylcysteine decarboxylase/phosphopantothenate--cysteine ligase